MEDTKDPLIAELASRIGNLGVEVADIAGNLDEVTGRAAGQAAQFKELLDQAQTMVVGNREIDRAARKTQGPRRPRVRKSPNHACSSGMPWSTSCT
jgi:methyl-accepting chemotaxis protein